MSDHSQRQHARLSASKADIWTNCPGSVALENDHPQKRRVTEWSRRGTALHQVAERMLKGHQVKPGDRIKADGGTYEVTAHDLEGVDIYLDYVNNISGRAEALCVYEVPLVNLAKIDPDLGGTADFIAVVDRSLIVVDFKAGTGVTVFAAGNLQALQYALGAYEELPPKLRREIDHIKLVIVQPWTAVGDPVKEWVVDPATLVEHAIKLQNAADRTRTDPTLKKGDWCRWCPVLHICPEYQAMLRELPLPRMDAPPSPVDLTPAQIGDFLIKAELLRPWLAEIYKIGLSYAEAGVPIPGMKLVPKRANRSFADPQTVPKVLKENFMNPQLAYKPHEIDSPAQVEKRIGKKVFAKVFPDTGDESSAIRRVSSGNNLVVETDVVKGPDLTPRLPSPIDMGLMPRSVEK